MKTLSLNEPKRVYFMFCDLSPRWVDTWMINKRYRPVRILYQKYNEEILKVCKMSYTMKCITMFRVSWIFVKESGD